ncbi:MAG: hypothetical protein AAGK32_08005, partial [Actinomycetota bacterium]
APAEASAGTSGTSAPRVLGLVALSAVLVVAIGWWLRRRRRAGAASGPGSGPTEASPTRDAVRTELERTNAELAEVEAALAAAEPAPTLPAPDPVLVASVIEESATHGLDRGAAAALLAQASGRPASFRVAAAARCSRPHRIATEATSARTALAGRILEDGPLDADGSTATLTETRQRLLDTRRLLERRLTTQGER